MIQPVDSRKTSVYAGAGLGAGVIIGGTAGYFTKPYMKNNLPTDEFVYSFIDSRVDSNLKTHKKLADNLKQVWQTGSIDGISDDVLKRMGDRQHDLKAMSIEERKAYADKMVKEGMEEFGVDTYDELIKRSMAEISDDSVANTKKRIASYDNLIFAEGTEPDVMKETLKKHANMFQFDEHFQSLPLDEAIDAAVDGKSVREVNQFILNEKQALQQDFDNTLKYTKDAIGEYLTGKTGEHWSSQDLKETGKRIDKLVKKCKLKAAGKWAAISGGTLAVLGAGAAILTGKKKA